MYAITNNNVQLRTDVISKWIKLLLFFSMKRKTTVMCYNLNKNILFIPTNCININKIQNIICLINQVIDFNVWRQINLSIHTYTPYLVRSNCFLYIYKHT